METVDKSIKEFKRSVISEITPIPVVGFQDQKPGDAQKQAEKLGLKNVRFFRSQKNNVHDLPNNPPPKLPSLILSIEEQVTKQFLDYEYQTAFVMNSQDLEKIASKNGFSIPWFLSFLEYRDTLGAIVFDKKLGNVCLNRKKFFESAELLQRSMNPIFVDPKTRKPVEFRRQAITISTSHQDLHPSYVITPKSEPHIKILFQLYEYYGIGHVDDDMFVYRTETFLQSSDTTLLPPLKSEPKNLIFSIRCFKDQNPDHIKTPSHDCKNGCKYSSEETRFDILQQLRSKLRSKSQCQYFILRADDAKPIKFIKKDDKLISEDKKIIIASKCLKLERNPKVLCYRVEASLEEMYWIFAWLTWNANNKIKQSFEKKLYFKDHCMFHLTTSSLNP